MSCSKASPFTKEEETFIVKKFAVLGSRKAVKRAFIKEFQGGRKSRWQLRQITDQQFFNGFKRFEKNGIAKSFHQQHVRGVDKTDLIF